MSHNREVTILEYHEHTKAHREGEETMRRGRVVDEMRGSGGVKSPGRGGRLRNDGA